MTVLRPCFIVLSVAVGTLGACSNSSSSTPPTTLATSGVHAVDWRNATVSLEACGLSGVTEVHAGTVNFGGTIPTDEPMHLERSRDLSIGRVTFGDVNGDHRDEAFVPVWCTNGGGTAAGQTAFAIEVYEAGAHAPVLLGILRPTQPDSTDTPHIPYMDDASVRVRGGSVTATELWYDSSDGTCCPSLRVVTTWVYRSGKFEHESSTTPRRVGN